MKRTILTAASLLLLFSQSILAKNLWLNIAVSSEHDLHVVAAKEGEFRIPPRMKRPQIKPPKGWEIVALNDSGDEIYRTFIKDTREQRFENFDPDSGEIVQTKKVFLDPSSIEVILPYENALSGIKIMHSDTTHRDKASTLELTRDNIENIVSQSSTTERVAEIHSEQVHIVPNMTKKPMIVAIIGDGYTANEMGNWASDAKQIIDGFFSDPLMHELERKFEFVRIDLPSQDSGITVVNGVKKNTALKTELGCYATARLLCVDTELTTSAANQALGVGNYDQILVVANTTDYGGAGYSTRGIGTLTMHGKATELALHEFGHAAFALADEYNSGDTEDCLSGSEPVAPNVTRQTDRDKIKWSHLIDSQTSLPTEHLENGTIGLFDGAEYCAHGKYRPVYNSKMRKLYQPWYAVNEEHIRLILSQFGT